MNITLKDVVKDYHGKVALEVPSLVIGEGKLTAVLGESGAGKTTLLSVVAGTLPFRGRVKGAGRVSYLFQNPRLLPNLTVEGNLKFVLPKERWGEIAAMLARVELNGRAGDYPAALSGGERQRVAIARAFLFPHDTLLMDEPFASLDLSLKKSLVGLTLELHRERGDTVLFVTHDVHEAAVLSERALVLRGGRVVADLCDPTPLPRDFFAAAPLEGDLIRALVFPRFGEM